MQLPVPFVWEQRDAGRVRCDDCGETMAAETIDLHFCGGDA